MTRAPRRVGGGGFRGSIQTDLAYEGLVYPHIHALKPFPWPSNGTMGVIQCRINMDTLPVSDKLLSARDNPLVCPVVEDDEQ